MSPIFKLESKPVGADDCATVNNHARADFRSFSNCHVRINQTCLSDGRFVTQISSCANGCVIANRYTCFDDGMRLNRNARAEFCAGIDDRGGMNSGSEGYRFRRKL